MNFRETHFDPQYQIKLFEKGFFASDIEFNCNDYPFFGMWNKYCLGKCYFFVHPNQQCFIYGNRILIGHAYNPFTMEFDEMQIIKTLTVENFNQLTGIFTLIIVDEDKLRIAGDATCMQSVFYGVIDGHYFISTHANLIADILNLNMDPYIKKLTSYRFFKLFGVQLPGDLSAYSRIKRLVPNHFVKISNKTAETYRFYYPHTYPINNDQIVKKTAELLHNSLKLISKKWIKPAVSLTGGCDSKTTLSCANGLYDKFSYFSYVSSDEEKVDASAAQKICKTLGLKHTIYEIPRLDSEIENIDIVRNILNHNCGELSPNNANDVRKRAWFSQNVFFDIEVKSWASEIGRAYYSKRFAGRKNFGNKPTPRKCSTLYKVFFHNRALLRKTDAVFADYLKNYFEQDMFAPLPWQEQFFWEFRVSAWNALSITHEQKYSFDITIPYNNRILLEILLSAPIEDRIKDKIYCGIRKSMDGRIDETNISVTNVRHTKIRAILENIYYIFNNIVP